MPDWFAPAAVFLPLSVLAVGWVAFQWSERQQRGPARRDHDDPLGAETLTVLSCIPSIVVVLDADGKILRADAMAYAKGLVRDGALAHAKLRDLVAAATQ